MLMFTIDQCTKLAPVCRSKPTRIAKDRSEGLKMDSNQSQLTGQNSGTMQRTELADHFLESVALKKYKYVGLMFVW